MIDDDRHVGHDAGTVRGTGGADVSPGLVREVKSFTGLPRQCFGEG